MKNMIIKIIVFHSRKMNMVLLIAIMLQQMVMVIKYVNQGSEVLDSQKLVINYRLDTDKKGQSVWSILQKTCHLHPMESFLIS